MEEQPEDIKRGLHKHEEKLQYLESQSRRNNIRIDGIPEEVNESWLNTETKVKEALHERLNLSFEQVIEQPHRVGARQRPSAADGINRGPRAIVRLRDWKQKDEILRAARRIKPFGRVKNEEPANETLERRLLHTLFIKWRKGCPCVCSNWASSVQFSTN